MSERINAAHRLDQILRKAYQQPDEVTIVNAWQSVFELEIEDPNRVAVEVVRKLGLLIAETDEIREAMTGTTIRPQQYENAFNNVAAVLDVRNMAQQWRNQKANLTGEVMAAIGWCADVLPAEEEVIEADDLAAFRLSGYYCHSCSQPRSRLIKP